MVDATLRDVCTDRLREHIAALEGVRHPVAAPEALARAERYLRRTLAELGYATTTHGFEDGGKSFNNVIATHPGTLRPERRVLVVAHFDTVSISPGADDNASGVAVLLELARILRPFGFEKTVQFVGVNLEENSEEGTAGTGLRGSRALAADARKKGWEIDAVVVLESVAYAGPTARQTVPAGLPIKAPEAGDFIACVGNEASRGLVQAFCKGIEANGIALPCLPLVVPGNGEMVRDTRRSDHARFWDQGYPAIMLTDTTNFRNPHYHLPDDTLATLNLPFAAQVCRATAALVADLAGLASS